MRLAKDTRLGPTPRGQATDKPPPTRKRFEETNFPPTCSGFHTGQLTEYHQLAANNNQVASIVVHQQTQIKEKLLIIPVLLCTNGYEKIKF